MAMLWNLNIAYYGSVAGKSGYYGGDPAGTVIDTIEANLGGKKMPVMHFNWQMSSSGTLQHFVDGGYQAKCAATVAANAIPFITIGTWDMGQRWRNYGLRPAKQADGTWNAYWTQTFTEIKNWGGKVWIRLPWEFNVDGWWQADGNFPWCLGTNSDSSHTITGTTTNGSNSVTGISSNTDIAIGMGISGTGIPANTTVTAVGSSTLTLSANATASGTPTLTIRHTWTNTAADIRGMFLTIAQIRDAVGALNAILVWCPNVRATGGKTASAGNLSQFWPGVRADGTAYMDQVGFDGYQDGYGCNAGEGVAGTNIATATMIFRGGHGTVFTDSWGEALALPGAAKLPFCIPETNVGLNGLISRAQRALYNQEALEVSFPNLANLIMVSWFWWWFGADSGQYCMDLDGHTITATTTNGSNSITSVSSTTNIGAGCTISGAGIPANAYVTAVGSGVLTLNTGATASASGVTLNVGSPTDGSSTAIFNTSNVDFVQFAKSTGSAFWIDRSQNVIPSGISPLIAPRLMDQPERYRKAIRSTLGLKAFWRLNEASGTFADDTGNGHTGTAAGSVSYNQATIIPANTTDRSLGLNGTVANHIDVGNAADLTPGAAFTAAGTFTCTALPGTGTMYIYGKGSAGQIEWSVGVTALGEVIAGAWTLAGTSLFYITGPIITAGPTAHDFVLTIEVGVSQGAKLTLDGNVAGKTTTGISGSLSHGTQNLWIGSRNLGSPDQGWNGQLQALQIFDRAITDQTITEIHNISQPGPVITALAAA